MGRKAYTQREANVQPAAAVRPAAGGGVIRSLVICAVLAAATAAAYVPIASNGFTNYDDPQYLIENPMVQRGLTWENVRWAFTSIYQYNWHPLTWLSLMIEWDFFQDHARGYHIVSLVMHILSSVLLYLVLARMTRAVWPSAAVAALFALHPMHVESVAWVAERKDVLSGVFWVLTMGAYAWYAERPGVERYLAIVAMLALGLMAKPMLVTLPLVLLLLDFWPLDRMKSWRDLGLRLLEKLPLLAMVAASSYMTYYAQSEGGAVTDAETLPFPDRLLNAIVAYGAYLGKAVWPVDLCPYYPYVQPIPMKPVVMASVVLAVLTLVVAAVGWRRRYLVVGWLWFLGTLVPVIGLVQVGSQSMADRYTYIPYIGLFMAVAWGAAGTAAAVRRAWPGWAAEAAAAGLAALTAGVLVVLAVLTHAQSGYWHDTITLLRHALDVTTDNDVANNNLGIALMDKGDREGAVRHFREAIRINPGYAHAQNNLGSMLMDENRLAEAEERYRIALQLDDTYADAAGNLVVVLVRQGRWAEALEAGRNAIRIAPGSPAIWNNVAAAFNGTGRFAEAEAHARRALELDRKYADAWGTRGIALNSLGRQAEAVQSFREALALKPGYPAVCVQLAWLHATSPDAKIRNGPEAVRLILGVFQSTGRRDAWLLGVLAAAYAESGRFEEAVAAARDAMALAQTGGNADLVAQIQPQLECYQRRLPWRNEMRPTAEAVP